MPWWYSTEYNGLDEMLAVNNEQRVQYGYCRYGLTPEANEEVMAFGGAFMGDVFQDDDGVYGDAGCVADAEELYIDTRRQAYREAYWSYMAENDNEFFSF